MAAEQLAQLAIHAEQLAVVPVLKKPDKHGQAVKSLLKSELGAHKLQTVVLWQSIHPTMLHSLTQLVPVALTIKSPLQLVHLVELQAAQLAWNSVQTTQTLLEFK